MFVVDTNILVYAANCDCAGAREVPLAPSDPARAVLALVPDVGNRYEFLRVATHPGVLRMPFALVDAWAFVEAVLAAPSVGVLLETENHRRVVSEVLAEIPDIKGNLVFDAHTAVLMKEHGLKTIYTRDTDFNRFRFLDVFDPIQDNRRTTSPALTRGADSMPLRPELLTPEHRSAGRLIGRHADPAVGGIEDVGPVPRGAHPTGQRLLAVLLAHGDVLGHRGRSVPQDMVSGHPSGVFARDSISPSSTWSGGSPKRVRSVLVRSTIPFSTETSSILG